METSVKDFNETPSAEDRFPKRLLCDDYQWFLDTEFNTVTRIK